MLAGNLADFSLTDIFQLFTLTKKSGALVVTHAGADGRVYFRGGDVCFAVSDSRRLPLGARLVSGGHLSEERLRALLKEHRHADTLELARAFVSGGDVDTEVLARLLREQTEDAVVSLMRLNEGRFTFDHTTVVDSWSGPTVATPTLVEAAGRRLAEWADIAEHLPGGDTILAVVPNLAGEEVTLSSAQWHLLALVDGRRTVANIVELTGQSEFVASRELAGLVTAGLLEVCEEVGRGALAELLAGREVLRALEKRSNGTATGSADIESRHDAGPVRGPADADAAPKVDGSVAASAPTSSSAVSSPPVAENVAQAASGPEPTDAESPNGEQAEPPAQETVDEPGEEAAAEEPIAPERSSAQVDRAQMARELASLGFGDGSPGRRPAPSGRAEGNGGGADGAHLNRLTAHDDLNRGLLGRFMGGARTA